MKHPLAIIFALIVFGGAAWAQGGGGGGGAAPAEEAAVQGARAELRGRPDRRPPAPGHRNR